MKKTIEEIQGSARTFIYQALEQLPDKDAFKLIHEIVQSDQPLNITLTINGREIDYEVVTNSVLSMMEEVYKSDVAERVVNNFDDLIQASYKITNLMNDLRQEVKIIAQERMNVELSEDY